jgi:hypothetical protein
MVRFSDGSPLLYALRAVLVELLTFLLFLSQKIIIRLANLASSVLFAYQAARDQFPHHTGRISLFLLTQSTNFFGGVTVIDHNYFFHFLDSVLQYRLDKIHQEGLAR